MTAFLSRDVFQRSVQPTRDWSSCFCDAWTEVCDAWLGFMVKRFKVQVGKKNLLRLFIWHPLPISSFFSPDRKKLTFFEMCFFPFLAIFLALLCHFYYHLLIPLKIVKFEISLCIQTCQLNTIQRFNTKTIFRQKYPNMTVLDAWIKVDSRSALGEQK